MSANNHLVHLAFSKFLSTLITHKLKIRSAKLNGCGEILFAKKENYEYSDVMKISIFSRDDNVTVNVAGAGFVALSLTNDDLTVAEESKTYFASENCDYDYRCVYERFAYDSIFDWPRFVIELSKEAKVKEAKVQEQLIKSLVAAI